MKEVKKILNGKTLYRCTKCGKWLPADKFYKSDSYLKSRDSRSYLCKDCRAEHGKKWREENKEYSKNWRAENRARMTVLNCRHRAKKAGKRFDKAYMMGDYLKELEKIFDEGAVCSTCKEPFDTVNNGKGKKRNWHCPSPDEILPGVGYIEGNVWTICWKCNKNKKNLTLEWFEEVIKRMKKAERSLVKRGA